MIPVAIAAGVVLAAAVGAWLLARRWRAGTAAVCLVLLLALLAIPRLFVVDGMLLNDARGMAGSHLAVIAGLDVGALGVGLLAFLVLGFVAPLIGAWLAQRRRESGSGMSLLVNAGLAVAAVLLMAVSSTSATRDLEFAAFRGERERIVAGLADGSLKAVQDKGRKSVQLYTPPGAYPRLACCGNVVYVLGGSRVLFPAEDGSVGWLHDASDDDSGFRVLKRLGGDWWLVAIDWPKLGAVTQPRS